MLIKVGMGVSASKNRGKERTVETVRGWKRIREENRESLRKRKRNSDPTRTAEVKHELFNSRWKLKVELGELLEKESKGERASWGG